MNEMKKFFYLAAALTVLAGAASCEKNIEQSQDELKPSGELRHVTITAGSAQTKTSVSGGVLTWSENDKLYIVPKSGNCAVAQLTIKNGAGSANATFEGDIDASITDETEIYGWCGGSWTYNSGSFTVNIPENQTYVANGLAENTFPSIGTGTIKSGITLENPMGVFKLTVDGEDTEFVKSITVTSTNNNLAGQFTFTPGDTPTVSGGSSKTVTLNVADPYVSLQGIGVNFYAVLPPAEYAASDLTATITFSDGNTRSETFTEVVTIAAGNAPEKKLVSDYTGRRGTLNGQDYVVIKGSDGKYLKWATQNLAVTESGKQEWKPSGTGTGYIIGDYFQWAASYAGYGLDGTTGKEQTPANLVIYSSFSNEGAGGADNSITYKDGKTSGFVSGTTPYYDGSKYTKYTNGSAILDKTDDVANIVLKDTWRIPTGGSAGEFKAMREATYWAWNDTDKGYYVFKPGVGTSGAANQQGTYGTGDDKTKALLFFPLAGYGEGQEKYVNFPRSKSLYCSSTLRSDKTTYAYNVLFKPSSITLDDYSPRYYGFSVRPVSD